MRRIGKALALATGFALGGAPAFADLRDAMAAARQNDWSRARTEAQAQGGTAPIIIEWTRLRDRNGGADFDAYRRFLNDHPDWPGLDLLHQRGEAEIDARTPPSQVLAYFEGREPRTAMGAYWLALALNGDGREDVARLTLARAWTTLPFDAEAQALYMERFRDVLADHHTARLDDTLWRGAYQEADRMLPLVGSGWRALAAARQGLRQDRPGVDGLIAAVPAELRDSGGLAFERMAWRMRRDRYMGAAELMMAQSASAAKLGRPEAWSDRRRRLARQLMRDKDYREAYLLASQHRLAADVWPYDDLEWLAGYIALRFLNAPEAATDHFRRGRAAALSPVWMGRMAYWEGRALEAAGQPVQARAAYALGAEFQTSFYGQLAAEAAGLPPDPRLTGSETFPDGANAAFRSSSVYQAGVSLHEAGEEALAGRFFGHLTESLTRDEAGSMAARLEIIESPHVQIAIAKAAARRGIVLHKAYFPIIRVDRSAAARVPPELALAIARQESEFNPVVVSPAGARGMMQLMPGTAQAMARVTGDSYSLSRLTSDPVYNTRLGSAYLQGLRDRFGYSVPLIAAGYNAGPGRPATWMERYGDPRGGQVDPIDWIEHIPFRETRNYVMFVMEGLAPFRARLSGQSAPLGLNEALRAR